MQPPSWMSCEQLLPTLRVHLQISSTFFQHHNWSDFLIPHKRRENDRLQFATIWCKKASASALLSISEDYLSITAQTIIYFFSEKCFHVVYLQEVWFEKDYNFFANCTKNFYYISDYDGQYCGGINKVRTSNLYFS